MESYKPTWLRGTEAVKELCDYGLGSAEARALLTRAVVDQGIYGDRNAGDDVLFRLSHVITSHKKSAWGPMRPDPDDILWPDFTIDAPHTSRMVWDQAQIEVSSRLIQSLLTKPSSSLDELSHRRYGTDDALVVEGVEGIASRKWANPSVAAKALAPHAEGNSTLDSKETRLRKKIVAQFALQTSPKTSED